MMDLLKSLFGKTEKVDFKKMVADGAVILDVRTPQEFNSGHIKGAMNIPVQDLGSQLKRIKKDKPVITCCASGMRSATAASVLKSAGFTEVYNGGGWNSLENKLN
jgi:phage shock protein E